MKSNIFLIDFIINNILLIGLVIFSAIKIVPAEWAGFWKYNNNKKSDGIAPKITFLQFFLTNLIDGVLRSFLFPILAMFEFKKVVTFIIFIVVIFDVFFRHQISGEATTLVGVGILSLYLDKLIETGKEIHFLGGLIYWEKDENIYTHTTNDAASEKNVSLKASAK